MNRDDAAREIVIATSLEAGGLHHSEECFLVWMHPNGLRQVPVAVGIGGDQLAEQRQNAKRVQVVQRLQARGNRVREFEHQQLPAGLQRTPQGGQSRRLVGHIAQSEPDGDAVEGVVRERQPLCVGLHITHVADEAVVDQPIAATCEHRGIDVSEDHEAAFADLPGHAGRQVAGAAGNVQGFLARPQVCERQGEPFPQPVDAR